MKKTIIAMLTIALLISGCCMVHEQKPIGEYVGWTVAEKPIKGGKYHITLIKGDSTEDFRVLEYIYNKYELGKITGPNGTVSEVEKPTKEQADEQQLEDDANFVVTSQ